MKKGSRYIFTLLFLLVLHRVIAQVQVRAVVDKDSILIGQPLRLTLQAYVPLGETVTWFKTDTFPHFEVLERLKVDTTEGIDGKKFEQVLTITSFDSGSRFISPLQLQVSEKVYFTDTLPINVVYTNFNPADDYRDIKEIEEIPHPYAKYIPWIVGFFVVVSIALVAYFLRRKTKPVVVENKKLPVLSAFEEAMRELALLRKQEPADHAQVKLFYTRLNDILRLYLSRQLSTTTFEKTNAEIVRQLRSKDLSAPVVDKIATALMVSDAVKFAKYKPESNDNLENIDLIESAIKSINTAA